MQVCGLAKKVHDSPPTGAAFDKIVDADKNLQGQIQTLARRCPSRWNSEYDCLNSALKLRAPVTELVTEMKLKAFKLSSVQWSLAQDLSDLLSVHSSVLNVLFTDSKLFQCLEELTRIFSRRDGSRPLITEVIPEMENLRQALSSASEMKDLPNVCRVAAYAGGLILDKYYDKITECEAYEIAMGQSICSLPASIAFTC